MTTEDLYPYWDDVHDEMIELLEWLPIAAWEYRPQTQDARSVRQIVLHLIEQERFWMVHLAQEGPWERPAPADFRTPATLIEGLRATRAQTKLFVSGLKSESLKGVRAVPTDAVSNMPATNRQIAWLIWQVVQHEIYHWGQIQARRYEALG